MIKRVDERFHETVYILKLKNGMQVHILPKEDPYYTTYVELSVPFGAIDLSYRVGNQIQKTPYGSAHFFEHKIFAMPDGDAFGKFSMLGVDANAMTSYHQTSYLFTATENVMEALDHLLKMIDTTYFTAENVENEKSIIAEELKMYLDDPNVVLQNRLMENLYHQHPIRYDIGGTLESIMEMTPEILEMMHQTVYQPSNRLITIAGKVDIKVLKAYFKAYDQTHPIKVQKPKMMYPKEFKKPLKRMDVMNLSTNIDKLLIGIKLTPRRLTPRDQIKREMAIAMMLNILLGSSSQAYEKLLEEQLINSSFSIQTTFENKAESIMIYAETKKIKRLKSVLVRLLTEDGYELITKDAFDRYKKVYLGQFVFALNNLENKAYLYGKYHHMGSSLFEVVDLLSDMTFEEVKNSFHEMKKPYMSILINQKA
jgi:predicted Zn-dependent peptidase